MTDSHFNKLKRLKPKRLLVHNACLTQSSVYVWMSQNCILILSLNHNTHNSSFSRMCDDNAMRAVISNINAIVFSGNNLSKKKGKRKREHNFYKIHSHCDTRSLNATRTHPTTILFAISVFFRSIFESNRSVTMKCTHANKQKKLLNRVFGRNCLF